MVTIRVILSTASTDKRIWNKQIYSPFNQQVSAMLKAMVSFRKRDI